MYSYQWANELATARRKGSIAAFSCAKCEFFFKRMRRTMAWALSMILLQLRLRSNEFCISRALLRIQCRLRSTRQLSLHNYYNVYTYLIITSTHESWATSACTPQVIWMRAHTVHTHIRSGWHWYKCDWRTEENVRNFLHAVHYHASHLIHQMISSWGPLCLALCLHNIN